MDGRPTLETVARRADVSLQTVSKVLKAPHLVREETLERVQAAIAEVGYRPHGAARQLRTSRSRVIGLRLPPSTAGINGAVLDRFLHALTAEAQRHGYRVMLFTAPDDDGEIAGYAELLDTLQIDAFVLTSTHHDDPRTAWLAARGIPFVTFGRPWSSAAGVDGHPWVDVDGAAGTRAATEHLLERGHRRIAFLGWPEGSDTGDDRREGWRDAMLAAGVTAAEIDGLTLGVEDGVAEGSAAATRLLGESAPTAFVCTSDSLALGVLAATRSGGDHAQVAVVGFDDTPVARAIGLTSIAQPVAESAASALTLLLRRLGRTDGPAPTDEQVLLMPQLVVRATSAGPAP